METSLTIKSEVSKQSRQHVHDQHGEDGQVGHVLHPSPGAAVDTNTAQHLDRSITSSGGQQQAPWPAVTNTTGLGSTISSYVTDERCF